MAFNSSLLSTAWLVDMMSTHTGTYNIAAAGDTLKIALFNNSGSPTADKTLANQTYNVDQWSSASFEVFGTGWAAGGITLTTQTLTNNTGFGGDLHWVGGNSGSNVSVATTTLTNAYGCAIYDSTVANRVIVAIAFGGAYTSNVGTFSITWGTANGLASVFWMST